MERTARRLRLPFQSLRQSKGYKERITIVQSSSAEQTRKAEPSWQCVPRLEPRNEDKGLLH